MYNFPLFTCTILLIIEANLNAKFQPVGVSLYTADKNNIVSLFSHGLSTRKIAAQIYDMVINRYHFSFHKIQDKKVFLINVKIKIQDKEAHLKQSQS
jgi:hypothetical protein